MNDIIIGFSHSLSWEDLKIWINSIIKTNTKAEKILIMHNGNKDLIDRIESKGFKIVSPGLKQSDGSLSFSGQFTGIERFGEAWTLLKNIKSKYRYVLMTGSKDVCFQQDPFKYMEKAFNENPDKSILIGAEPSLIGKSNWNSRFISSVFGPIIFEDLKNEKVLNPDVLGGKAENFIDFLAIYYYFSLGTGASGSDQAGLPLLSFLSLFKDKILIPDYSEAWTHHHALFLDSPSEHELDIYPTLKNDKIYSSKSDKEYYIIHQYNRDKYLLDFIKKYYGDIE